MPQTIEFFYDCASPYSYLAATQIAALAERHSAQLQWRPLALGGVFKATGNRMPATVPAKGKYMLKDLKLWAEHYAVPFQFPKIFPVNSLLVQRIACAVAETDRAAYTLAAMKAYWTQGADIQQVAVLQPLLRSLGLDAEALIAAAQSEKIKAQLKANTEEAVSRGVFGAPSCFVGETQFWGNDRLPLMEAFLMKSEPKSL